MDVSSMRFLTERPGVRGNESLSRVCIRSVSSRDDSFGILRQNSVRAYDPWGEPAYHFSSVLRHGRTVSVFLKVTKVEELPAA